MRLASSSLRQRLAISFPSIIATALLSTGCGSNGNTVTTTPQFSGNTSVTVALSSTANDQISSLNLQFQSLALTSQSGKTATLLSGPASASTQVCWWALNSCI
jgi:hypothetical protein